MAAGPGSFDHRSFTRHGRAEPLVKATEAAERSWWTMKDGTAAADSISGVLGTLRRAQDNRWRQYVVNARLYNNRPLSGYAGFPRGSAAGQGGKPAATIRYNVTQSVIDTLVSKMIKNRPKPEFVTSGGDYRLQLKAKHMNRFVDGLFYDCKTPQKGIEALKDGCIQGDGLLKIVVNRETGLIEHDRVDEMEIWVDDMEAEFGTPRQMHHVRLVDRSVAESLWPDHKQWIRGAQQVQAQMNGEITVSDMIAVRESWRLPSSPNAKNGRHIITVEGHALTPMMEWKHDFFPFARFRFNQRSRGFWSQGIAEQLRSIQLEIDNILRSIQQSIYLGSTYKILMKIGSRTPTQHFNNLIGTIIEWAGDTPPQYITPPLVQPELYTHLWTLVTKAYDVVGMSQLSAAGQIPAGLSGSGESQRVYHDIQSDRFQAIGKSWEDFFLDAARISIALVREAASDRDGHYVVQATGAMGLRDEDWKEIGLDENSYRIRCYPVSALPSDPAGRIAMVEDWMRIGLIKDPVKAAQLMDFPDLEAFSSLAEAQENRLAEQFDDIIEHGRYTPPDAFDDQILARKRCIEYIKRSQCNGVEPEKIAYLETYIQQLDWIAKKSMPPPPPVTPVNGPIPSP